MKGIRTYPNEQGDFWLESGEYGKHPLDGNWYVRPPTGEINLLGSLAAHTVIEHEDGAITASPSILISGCKGDSVIQWHGYLEHGVWREC